MELSKNQREFLDLLEKWYNQSGQTVNTMAALTNKEDTVYKHFGDCSSTLSVATMYVLHIPASWFTVDISPLIKEVIKMARECFVYTEYLGKCESKHFIKKEFNYLPDDNIYYMVKVESKNFKSQKHQMMAHTILRYLWSPKFSRIMYHALKMRVLYPKFTALDCFVIAHYFYKETKRAFESYKGMMDAPNMIQIKHNKVNVVAPLPLGKVIAQVVLDNMLFNAVDATKEDKIKMYTTAMFGNVVTLKNKEKGHEIRDAIDMTDYQKIYDLIHSGVPDKDASITIA